MADKIKKFLTDNKGCPLTPAATKQLFVKFLEFLVDEGYGEELESLKYGVDKVNPSALVGLTHSFNELDPALKAIVDAAISTREEVACTQSQWDAIKVLLDKSLYINFNGYSLIKSYFNGINEYHFGTLAANHGEAVYLYFDTNRGMLTAEMDEV